LTNRSIRAFHDANLGLIKSLLNDTLRGWDSITVAMVSLLCRTMLYNAGYCSRRVVLPSQLSSQNLISDPSLMLKDSNGKKCFFVAIRPAQKWESPGFQCTWDIAFVPTYFLLRRVCQTPCSVSSLKSHFPKSAVFLTARSIMPNPPWF
jgi:hypothetical protein